MARRRVALDTSLTTPQGLEAFAAKMFVIVEPAENDIGHSKLFFLVDAQGGVRGIYESDRDDALERLVRDAEKLGGGAPQVAAAGASDDLGGELYRGLGCGACHARKDLAPQLEGLVGRRVKLESGGDVTADAAYVRESIVQPDSKLVAGYVLRMPAYGKDLTPPELDALVGYVTALKTITPNPGPAAKPSATPATSAPSAPSAPEERADAAAPEPATIAVDPVCSMNVRVTETTPRATHAGRTVYFCSEACRDRFTTDPARYANKEH